MFEKGVFFLQRQVLPSAVTAEVKPQPWVLTVQWSLVPVNSMMAGIIMNSDVAF